MLINTNTHVRLNGVDAPEVVHPSFEHDDDFGQEARSEMRRIIGDQVVRCELNGERSYERQRLALAGLANVERLGFPRSLRA